MATAIQTSDASAPVHMRKTGGTRNGSHGSSTRTSGATAIATATPRPVPEADREHDETGERREREVRRVEGKHAEARTASGPAKAIAPNDTQAASAAHAAASSATRRDEVTGATMTSNSTWRTGPAPSRARASFSSSCWPARRSSILMTWPLATGLGHLGRTIGHRRRRPVQHLEHRVGRAHDRRRSAAGSSTPTSSIRTRRRWPIRKPTSCRALIGVPAYWLTKNPWLTLNVVLLFAFTSAYVVRVSCCLRYLTGDRRAAAAGAMLYAFCPYVFSHLSHIQLLMTGGIPLSMLMLHRLADAARPPEGGRRRVASLRGVRLQAEDRAPRRRARAGARGAGAVVRLLRDLRGADGRLRRRSCSPARGGCGGPPRTGSRSRRRGHVAGARAARSSCPSCACSRRRASRRSVEDTARWSAGARDYLMSSSHAHAWLLAYMRSFGPWSGEVLFPGFLALALGAARVPRRRAPRRPAPRDGAALWLARDSGVLGVVRAGRGTLSRALLPADVLVPPRAVAAGPRRRPLPGGVRVLRAGRALQRARAAGCESRPPAIAVGRGRSRSSPCSRSGGPPPPICRRRTRSWRISPRAPGRRVPVLRRAHRVPAAHAIHAVLDAPLDAARQRLQRRHPGRLPRGRRRPRQLPVGRRVHGPGAPPRALHRDSLGHVRGPRTTRSAAGSSRTPAT